ncbi:leukocyte surface antigen CD53-like [Pristis pectinata]|uniref:leukocyte surface antigen CD53-like n=1 Tax=Pristis pectinata TaxID=685728 RepID=UPI00223E5B2B|nr:leukocyte surface antigen CD53-like [Pristis pectinata]
MALGCLKTLKYMLFAFNLIFWICGCTIMGLGIYMLGMQNVGALLSSLPSLSVANILIIVGCITMVVAFLGCTGAIKENKCLLLSFFILLLLILLTEVLAAIILFFYEKQIDSYIESDMKRALEELETTNSSGVKEIWDKIQAGLQCCGVVNYTDWKGNIPQSCCPEKACNSGNYFTKGCYGLIRDWFESNFLIIGITVICVSIVQVLGMSFAMTLYCHICNNYKSYGE